MPIVGPLLWLAVASLLIAFFGLLRENIRLKRKNEALEVAYAAQAMCHRYLLLSHD